MRIVSLLFTLLLVPSLLSADQVTGLGAEHRHGQTFITWTSPAGQGWTYRLYTAPTPIVSTSDLDAATLVGSVGDSTWCDRRLSRIYGVIFGYAIDSLATLLDSTRGLFVVTPGIGGSRYYAVTAQAFQQAQDQSLTPGQNSMTMPVSEIPSRPRLVYQRTVTATTGSTQLQVFTLWTSPVATPDFPAMANVYGLAYDCGIWQRSGGTGSWHALALLFHRRDGNFTQSSVGTDMPGEWGLALDDFTRNTADRNTWWFGYHQDYNTEMSGGVPPTAGTVHDFTLQRVAFTTEWALDNFPVDRTRVYAMGSSMGGTGSAMFAFWRPDLVAASFANVPRVDFAHEFDPNTYSEWPYVCTFNLGMSQRVVCDRLWGTLASDLSGSDGRPVYDWLSGVSLAAWREPDQVAPIVAFSGRRDGIIGWAEKPPFYEAMNRHRHGGILFWDEREHSTSASSAWLPMMQLAYLYRFRGDRTFPAISNCTANHDPGDGTMASGDTVGVINGFVEWDTLLTDTPSQWQVHLTLRNLTTRQGPLSAPESLTVDVTPRRVQQFTITPGGVYAYEVRRANDNVIVQTGYVVPDSLNLITVPAVPVYLAGGSLLTLSPAPTGVGDPASSAARLWLAPVQNPVRGDLTLDVCWPTSGPAELVLFDLSGRRRRVLLDDVVAAGQTRMQAAIGEVPPGIYFVRARQAGRTAVARLAIVR
ncbi:MAG: hypothetical protein HY567_04570 [Candidatus Kerfeldbacteria bacterium]|nr:hypothetical protein [Candidatus Kerfeldbacteria bacterium]